MHAKLALVILLSGLHGYFVAEGKRLARGERRRSEKFWRMINEAPFLIAIIVVILAVVEPF
jgi:protoporphyrinogen IX oxidase